MKDVHNELNIYLFAMKSTFICKKKEIAFVNNKQRNIMHTHSSGHNVELQGRDSEHDFETSNQI